MVDIHTHILPGIDDGARTMEDSVRMARTAFECGVSDLVVTPHCNVDGIFDNYNNGLMESYENFVEELKKERIPIRVMPGMEVYGTEEVPALLRKGAITTLNHSRYLLLEFNFRKDIALIEYLITEVVKQGYLPIIAHPERYPYVQKNPDMIYQWLEQGCSLQINKGSIAGAFGPKASKTALYFLDFKLAAIIASDAHSPLIRTTDMSGIYQYISLNYSKEYATVLLEENPRRVIEDKELSNYKAAKNMTKHSI